jgi:hypothetical protein
MIPPITGVQFASQTEGTGRDGSDLLLHRYEIPFPDILVDHEAEKERDRF